MTPELMLSHKLGQASRRVRTLLVYRWVARYVCTAAVICLVWLLASKLNWVDEPRPDVIGMILCAAALLGIGMGFVTRLTALDVARLTDKRTEMKERLASAVEFRGVGSADPILQRQIQDAGEHAGTLNLRRVYPIRVSREAIIAVALVAVLFGAFLLPQMPLFWSNEKKKEMEEVKRQGIAIEKVARDSEKTADKQKLAEAKKASADAKKLGQAMKKGQLTKKQSMIKMQKLTAKIEAQHKKLAAATAPKSLQKAAEEFKKAMEQQNKSAQDALKSKLEQAKQAKTDKMDQKLDSKAAEKAQKQNASKLAEMKKQSEAMQKAQEALQKFAQALMDQSPQAQNEALQQLADQMQKGEMSKEEMQQLSDQLKDLSKALSKTDLDKVAQQLAELAKLLDQLKLDPETLKKLASMMRAAGGT